MLLQESVPAATAIVGFDLLQGSTLRQSNKNRRIVAIGLTGSAAALDTLCQLFIGQINVADIFNSATGAPDRDSMFRVGDFVPAGVEVRMPVVDAPTTNPINPIIDFQDL